MAGLRGPRSASQSTRLGPTPSTQTPTIGPGAELVRTLQILSTSSHQVRSASASAHPGRGNEIWCARWADSITRPSGVTSSPLVLEVPMSIPSTTSTSATVVGQPGAVPGRRFADDKTLFAGDLADDRLRPWRPVGHHVLRVLG